MLASSKLRFSRWTALAVLPVGLAALPMFAQDANTRMRGDENRAKEIAELVKQGQLGLADAVKLAEKHANGTAFDVDAEVRAGELKPQRETEEQRRTPAPSGPAAQETSGKRIVYKVQCFASDKVQTVDIDGLTRRVIEGTAARKPAGDR